MIGEIAPIKFKKGLAESGFIYLQQFLEGVHIDTDELQRFLECGFVAPLTSRSIAMESSKMDRNSNLGWIRG